MDGRSPRSLRWLGALLVIYLGFPLAAFAVRAATGSDEGWNAPGLWSALLVSVVSATASLCIGVLTGVPLAYVLARRDGWLSRVVGVLIQLPLAVPPLITGIILIYIVGPYSFSDGYRTAPHRDDLGADHRPVICLDPIPGGCDTQCLPGRRSVAAGGGGHARSRASGPLPAHRCAGGVGRDPHRDDPHVAEGLW